MSGFVGRWKIVEMVNMTELLDSMDTPFWRKQLMVLSKLATLEITNPEENTWIFKTKIGPLSVDHKYELGVEILVEGLNGQKIYVTANIENENKFVFTTRDLRYAGGTIRQLTGDVMWDESVCNGVKATVKYERKT